MEGWGLAGNVNHIEHGVVGNRFFTFVSSVVTRGITVINLVDVDNSHKGIFGIFTTFISIHTLVDIIFSSHAQQQVNKHGLIFTTFY